MIGEQQKQAKGHQTLYKLYPEMHNLDTLIPHAYTPPQSIFLELIAEEPDFSLPEEEDKHLFYKHLEFYRKEYNIKFSELIETLEEHPPLLAWLRDFLLRTSINGQKNLLAVLEHFFPYNRTSLKILHLFILSYSAPKREIV